MLQQCPHDVTLRWGTRTLPVDKAFSVCNVSRAAGLLTSDKVSFLCLRNLSALSRDHKPKHWPLLLFHRTCPSHWTPICERKYKYCFRITFFDAKELCVHSVHVTANLRSQYPDTQVQDNRNTSYFKTITSQQQHCNTDLTTRSNEMQHSYKNIHTPKKNWTRTTNVPEKQYIHIYAVILILTIFHFRFNWHLTRCIMIHPISAQLLCK
jgi:hypothetical protein